MDTNLINQNRTLFYAPLWTDNFTQYCEFICSDARFSEIEKNDTPQYFFPYITNIYKDNKLFRAFALKPEFLPEMCMYKEKLGLDTAPTLESIKIFCFGLGCCFAEFSVAYGEMSVDEIENFSYEFKKASKTDKRNGYSVTMCDIIKELFIDGKNAEFNFSGADFKRECRMFHHVFVAEKTDSESAKKHLVHLSRGYKTVFDLPNESQGYDMIYTPYDNDLWAGSQEGLVNLFTYSDDADTNFFIDNYKRIQLLCNYRFMYLLLLNQRFTAIRLIDCITKYSELTKKDQKKLNECIVTLKTTYAFNVVSDDILYQNVYIRMYGIMDIDRFLADIKENEQQVEIIRNYDSAETEKKTSSFLFVLSLLSVFSVLIDAASYFDRIPLLKSISTVLSFICMATIIVFYISWWVRYMKK